MRYLIAFLITLLVALLTGYGPTELTLVLIRWGLAPQFIFEIIFMWAFWLAGVIVIYTLAYKVIDKS